MSMHRIPDLRSLAMIPVLVFTILGGPAPALADDRTPVACGRTWTPVAIPHFGQDNLEDIASTSASDVWAVGETGARTTLIEHWDGSGWSRVPSPTPGSWADLTSVTAFTPTDAWAIGMDSRLRPISEHWDGSSWYLVHMPSVPGYAYMYGASQIASDDVWATGWLNAGFGSTPLTLHWDGTAWQNVPNAPIDSGALTAVSGVSSSDVWAVGNVETSSGGPSLIEHWDGTAWSVVPSPSPGAWGNSLTGVAAVAADDAWAVGWFMPEPGRVRVLTEHWDGASWTAVRGYWSPTGAEALNGVAARNASDVWGVGYDDDQVGTVTTVVGRWNGSIWRRQASGNVGPDPQLVDVTVTADGFGWAVGSEGSNEGQKALIERACGI